MPEPNITFVTLREIAESASGMRDHDLWFVVTGNPNADVHLVYPARACGR